MTKAPEVTSANSMVAFHIDAVNRKIEKVEYKGLHDLQRLVGGNIELAMGWEGGDVMFVHDEGMCQKNRVFFFIKDGHQPFAGNGVIVGKERSGSARTFPPKYDIEELRKHVTWMTTADAVAWSKDRPEV